MTTVTEVVEWVEGIDDETVGEILSALQKRHDALHEARAEKAVPGAHVFIDDVTVECLIGLVGHIEEVDGDEGLVSIRLTATSTGRLRFSGQTAYRVGNVANFLLHGVPASCCYPAEGLAASA